MARQDKKVATLAGIWICSYVRVKDNDMNKLDPKARKYFFGHGSDDMGYRFWDVHKKNH